jgi:hypothetical protein
LSNFFEPICSRISPLPIESLISLVNAPEMAGQKKKNHHKEDEQMHAQGKFTWLGAPGVWGGYC